MPEPGSPSLDSLTPSTAQPALPIDLTSRLRALLEVLACSGVPSQFAIAAALQFAGLHPLDASGQLAAPFVFTLSLVDTVVITGLAVAFLVASGERPRDVFLGPRPAGREAVLGLALVPVVFLLVLVVMTVLRLMAPWLRNVPDNPLESLLNSPGRVALFAVVGIAAGGWREEVQRAFVLRRFERYLGGPLVGLLVVSIAFGAGHIVQGWDAMLTTGLLGAFWGALYLLRRSAIAPVVSHAGFNSVEILRVVLTR